MAKIKNKKKVSVSKKSKKSTDLVKTTEELAKLEEESRKQVLPEQKAVFSVSEKIRKRVHNLPDPTRPPLGYDEQKAFDRVYPYLRLPRIHPFNHGDTVIFNAPDLPKNQLVLGDNLELLRTLKSESVDLIYIDPPFFSGRNYNVIWGDANEVRSFHDIWEGGLDTYLIWLNARLWEMRRVLKSTGSIYVHCDWHANHYIKTELDKIFGYDNFVNEVVWAYRTGGASREKSLPKKHDCILLYRKSDKFKIRSKTERQYLDKPFMDSKKDELGRFYSDTILRDVIEGIIRTVDSSGRILEYNTRPVLNLSSERVGYPTQKPEDLLKLLIELTTDESSVVADFFVGGGTTIAAAMKLNRKFIACDSSRVAISVTLDRLVKIGEEMSGVESNVSKADKFQKSLGIGKDKVSNIEISYIGTYPVEKFAYLPQEDFISFVLTAYGASRNTAEGVTHGYRPPAQQEPILIGPTNPNESIDPMLVKAFFDEIKNRLEPNKMVYAKIIGWRFSRQIVGYIKILRKFILENNLPLEMDLVPLDSKEFRHRVLQRYLEVEEGETLLRFSKMPIIGDIRVKKAGPLEYEFEAVDAFSTNEDGWLVNCQWDFDYEDGHFTADDGYVLSREKVKDKNKGEHFEAILKARYKLEKRGECIVACKVQDNLGGEAILAKKIKVE